MWGGEMPATTAASEVLSLAAWGGLAVAIQMNVEAVAHLTQLRRSDPARFDLLVQRLEPKILEAFRRGIRERIA